MLEKHKNQANDYKNKLRVNASEKIEFKKNLGEV